MNSELYRKLKTNLLFTVIIVAFVCFAVVSESYAQENDPNSSKSSNAIYSEIGGSGLLGVGFDRLILDNISVHAGISNILIGFSVPVGVSYITDGKNKFEAGIGATYINGEFLGHFENLLGSVFIGYRRQPDPRGFFLKTGITVHYNGDGVGLLPGINLGYAF